MSEWDFAKYFAKETGEKGADLTVPKTQAFSKRNTQEVNGEE